MSAAPSPVNGSDAAEIPVLDLAPHLSGHRPLARSWRDSYATRSKTSDFTSSRGMGFRSR
jgi:hypothetical protein